MIKAFSFLVVVPIRPVISVQWSTEVNLLKRRIKYHINKMKNSRKTYIN